MDGAGAGRRKQSEPTPRHGKSGNRKAKLARTVNLDPAQLARRVQIGEQRRAKTRQKLLRAAYHLFAVHGADAPTIDDIVVQARVARGTFYNHFDTRDALFKAVGVDVSAAINGMITRAIEKLPEPVERLALAFRLFVRFAVADPSRGWILLRTMPLAGPLNAGAKEFIRSEFEAAAATGRLRELPLSVLIDLGLGLQIMTIHRLLTEKVGSDHVDMAAQAMLIAIGIPPREAESLAHRPMADDAIAPPAPQLYS